MNRNFDDWLEKYTPVANPNGQGGLAVGDDIIQFETFGLDIEVVRSTNTENVWTLIECDEGLFIAAGMHMVNRQGYLITKQSHEGDSQDDYVVWLEEEFET